MFQQMKILAIMAGFFSLLIAADAAFAAGNQKADLQKFYKPVTSKDLIVNLPPRPNKKDRFASEDAFLSGSGACPNEINIGSIPDSASLMGGADINVSVGGDIIIQCGSGF